MNEIFSVDAGIDCLGERSDVATRLGLAAPIAEQCRHKYIIYNLLSWEPTLIHSLACSSVNDPRRNTSTSPQNLT